MSKRLIIVRHGNTFLPGQTPTRVGERTDLPLVEENRARAVGRYLSDNNIIPDKVYAAPLKRTTETAELIIDEAKLNLDIVPVSSFNEIDYGPDENKTEHDVQYRLGLDFIKNENISTENITEKEILMYGEKIIGLWNSKAIVPNGWQVDVKGIILNWQNFANSISEGETVLICTSNGIIRFAPYILNESYDAFSNRHDLKVATGSISVFDFENGKWICSAWNIKPYNIYKQ